jgi:hypothetical protein
LIGAVERKWCVGMTCFFPVRWQKEQQQAVYRESSPSVSRLVTIRCCLPHVCSQYEYQVFSCLPQIK